MDFHKDGHVIMFNVYCLYSFVHIQWIMVDIKNVVHLSAVFFILELKCLK